MSIKEEAIELLKKGNELKVLRFANEDKREVLVTRDFSYEKALKIDYDLAKEMQSDLTLIKKDRESKDCESRIYKHNSIKVTTTELLDAYTFQVKGQYGNVRHSDNALSRILNAKIDDIRGIIETSTCAEEFHKNFRSSDVTDDGLLDMVAWELMHDSSVFLNLVQLGIKEGLDL